MAKLVVGQRWSSEAEPELGPGKLVFLQGKTLTIQFGQHGESRSYRTTGAPIKRLIHQPGEEVKHPEGSFMILEREEREGLLYYRGDGIELCESELIESTTPKEDLVQRLFEGESSKLSEYEMRSQARALKTKVDASSVSGLLGVRIDNIPHQLQIAARACSEPRIPRRLLSDEVGLGKTIEAGLIYHRLKVTGQVKRTLILAPESLVNQWLVELYRRFNTLFTLVDDDHCDSVEEADKDANPYQMRNDVLCDTDFVFLDSLRQKQILECKWDLIIIDEAHRIDTGDNADSFEYNFLAKLTKKTPGLLLLTATPIQVQLEAHFARLKLIDPIRFGDFETWLEEHKNYRQVAEELAPIIDDMPDSWADVTKQLPADSKVNDFLQKYPATRTLGVTGGLRFIADFLGTGRSVVRNTRSAIGGFPGRELHVHPLDPDEDYAADTVQFLQDDVDEMIDYSKVGFRFNLSLSIDKDCLVDRDLRIVTALWCQDEKVKWLVNMFKGMFKNEKILIICSSREVVVALNEAIQRLTTLEVAMFFEDMPIVARDRAAAFFADEEGADMLIASEIGSEGRNFQFAHHLVMFDLPLDPGLLEQRIGRLDRIGQRETINIHVPWVKGRAGQRLYEFYQLGLNAFIKPVLGVEALYQEFQNKLGEYLFHPEADFEEFHAQFLPHVKKQTIDLRKNIEDGRDKLMEFSSYDAEIAKQVVADIEEWDNDYETGTILLELIEEIGVTVKKGRHTATWILKPTDHMTVPEVPGISEEGMTVTLDRATALSHENIEFLTVDHPLAQAVFDIWLGSDKGETTFCQVDDWDRKGIFFEFGYLWQASCPTQWNLQRLFSPKGFKVLINKEGQDFSDEIEELNDSMPVDGHISVIGKLKEMLGGDLGSALIKAKELCKDKSNELEASAKAEAIEAFKAEIQRLMVLKEIDEERVSKRIKQLQGFAMSLDDTLGKIPLRLETFRLIVSR